MSNARELAELGGAYSTGGYPHFKNRIINGAMMIDQRNAGASVTPTNNAYVLDRWQCGLTQASKFTVQQNAGAVTLPVGYTNYLGVTSSSAYSVVSGDVFRVSQFIEGFNVSDLGWGTLNAQTVTLSFWVRSSLIGTFGGSLINSAADRSYPFSYTINSANTWEQKVITVAGDTSGTWLKDNGIGVRVGFGLGCGSSFSSSAGSWQAGTYLSATGATSVVGTNGATFYITGVQLEKGSTATAYDYRPYGTELALCQRYYQKNVADSAYTALGSGAIDSATQSAFYIKYTTTMRASPTLAYGGSLTSYTAATFYPLTAINTGYLGKDSALWQPTSGGGGMTVGRGCLLLAYNSSTAYIEFSAEL